MILYRGSRKLAAQRIDTGLVNGTNFIEVTAASLTVGLGHTFQLILLLDGIGVRGALGGR